MTMTTREAFDKGTDAFNAHDINGFAALIADDAVFTAPGGISGAGKEACAQFFGSWLTAFPDANAAVDAVHIDGVVAVEEGTFTGTHRGVLQSPAGDVPPTGRRVSADYIQVLRFRDGKMISFNLMFDQLQLLEQLGLLPAPEPAG
jgi:steroid delta-isomerase-like uncharacterized protein